MPQSLEYSDLLERISELEGELEVARGLSFHDIASRIEALGFECIRCGGCCTGPDLEVFLFPKEISRICRILGQKILQVAEPPATGEWDIEGNYHTLEWRLRHHNGKCMFYSSGCQVYGARPALCRTYPFYISQGALRFSECRGLGRPISKDSALLMAEALRERYISEILESIALLSRYRDFVRGSPSQDGSCIVHDSAGEHRISWDDLPGLAKAIFKKNERQYSAARSCSKEDKSSEP